MTPGWNVPARRPAAPTYPARGRTRRNRPRSHNPYRPQPTPASDGRVIPYRLRAGQPRQPPPSRTTPWRISVHAARRCVENPIRVQHVPNEPHQTKPSPTPLKMTEIARRHATQSSELACCKNIDYDSNDKF